MLVESSLLNFKLIDRCVDVQSIVDELAANEAMWFVNTSRQETVQVQRETQSIFLRSADRSAYAPQTSVNDVETSKLTGISRHFPTCMAYLESVAAALHGQLERAIIVRLKGDGEVFPHIDRGSYYAKRDRYHLVVTSPEGSSLTSGDETVVMEEGELWWFDNKQMHSSKNLATDWRIHIIFDLLPIAVPKSA